MKKTIQAIGTGGIAFVTLIISITVAYCFCSIAKADLSWATKVYEENTVIYTTFIFIGSAVLFECLFKLFSHPTWLESARNTIITTAITTALISGVMLGFRGAPVGTWGAMFVIGLVPPFFYFGDRWRGGKGHWAYVVLLLAVLIAFLWFMWIYSFGRLAKII